MAIIVLRRRQKIELGPDIEIEAPALPKTWTVLPQGGTDWHILVDPKGRRFKSLCILQGKAFGQPKKILCAWFPVGKAAKRRLKALAEGSDLAWTIQELREDVSPLAMAIKAKWPYSRPKDLDGNLLDDGLPDIAIRQTITGFKHHLEAEGLKRLEDLP